MMRTRSNRNQQHSQIMWSNRNPAAITNNVKLLQQDNQDNQRSNSIFLSIFYKKKSNLQTINWSSVVEFILRHLFKSSFMPSFMNILLYFNFIEGTVFYFGFFNLTSKLAYFFTLKNSLQVLQIWSCMIYFNKIKCILATQLCNTMTLRQNQQKQSKNFNTPHTVNEI